MYLYNFNFRYSFKTDLISWSSLKRYIKKKKTIESFYRNQSSPPARENLSSLIPPRIPAQRVQLRTVPWLFLFYGSYSSLYRVEVSFFFFFYEQILEPSTVINITGVKQHECLLPSRKVRRKLFQPSAWMLFTVLIHANFNGCSTLDDFPPLFTTPSRKRWNVRSRISHESRAIKGKLLIRKLSRFDQFRFKCCVLIIADV